MSRWWKCDLQVATPREPNFHAPVDGWNLATEAGRAAAADRYMAAAKDQGLEVLVLADHNNADWTDEMVEAGKRAGIVVFPGMEITTASGQDGAHLVIIGDLKKTSADLTTLLHSVCGYGPDFPVTAPDGTPAISSKTMLQVLDDLPEDYLAFAPHAFNDNGILSKRTVNKELRWRSLHHPRLGAVDVGDGSGLGDSDSFRAKWIRRELAHFPCLPNLAWVSTSDAYALTDLGSRFTWIRMSTPTLEALRQAFLDHYARIVCDWDERFTGTAVTPNDIPHAWIEQLTLKGLPTATGDISVNFDSRLNVIIGGRGSGKSTIVAALRNLYGDLDSLPRQAQAEARELIGNVFASATVEATHHLAHSGEGQVAKWSAGSGPTTQRPGASTTVTDFKIRVMNQKELFERAANVPNDRFITSRNLLNLVDDALAAGSSGPGSAAAFQAAFDEVRTEWVAAARRHQSEREAVKHRDVVAARVAELTRQVEAFDNPASAQRRVQNDLRRSQATWFDRILTDTESALDAVTNLLESRIVVEPLNPPVHRVDSDSSDFEFPGLADRLAAIREDAVVSVSRELNRSRELLRAAEAQRATSQWQRAVEAAADDVQEYLRELAELGLDPDAYEQVQAQLANQSAALESLERRIAELPKLEAEVHRLWLAMETMLEQRRANRAGLLDQVAERSELLRFTLTPARDEVAWSSTVRDLLGLRSDGFLEEVPLLAAWLWSSPEGEVRNDRLADWQLACVTGDFSPLPREAGMRTNWVARLTNLDPLVRTRLAAEVAPDVIEMQFLREHGDPGQEGDWQPLTAGSPGQRSAAMLSFVLNYGVEPLVLDQPEDDLDTEWISELVVRQLRSSRWSRQLIVVTHNANIPVNADAERILVLENSDGGIRIRGSNVDDDHVGSLEDERVRADIQQIMEGGVEAFVRRERRYNNELNTYRAAMRAAAGPPDVEHGGDD